MERTHRLLLFFTIAAAAAAAEAQTSNITTDQFALLSLKSHITSDPQNVLTTNWSTTASNICHWVGVTCGARHLRVAALNLSYMGLTGTIPPHLGNLSFLVKVDFVNNSFHGTFPQELARLRRLKLVNFGFNNFMGTIPSWFGSLPKLQIFNLYGNQFSGSIPADIFNLSALQAINLRYNQLTGSIPREIGNLTMLKDIRLDFNNFKEIPNEIGSIEKLERLYVQANALTGPVPAAIFNMSFLTLLALAGNSLNASIPDNVCLHLSSIQRLLLGHNQFDGPLPSKLWQCKELSILGLDFNNFNGGIPKSIGNLTQITKIYFGFNNLTGTIPDEIGNLQNLQALTLGVNNLSGPIPSAIFNMSMMTAIDLTENQLSGSLPADIGLGVPNLQELYVGGNKIRGIIPNSISNLSKLARLDMGGNSFSGLIPTKLCTLPNLEYLSLFRNNLTVDTSTPELNILSCLVNLRKLKTLFLGGNQLNATLPFSFRNFSASIHYVAISNCNMRGNIPNDIGYLSSLLVLDLRNNKLGGLIPTSVGKLGSLQGLFLSGNKFEGGIPFEICQLENLAELVLDGNQLSGSIPSCLSSLARALRRLSLGSNLLTSTIPSTLWGLEYILYLNLSFNFLNGSLSEDIGKLKVVISLHVSNNHLSGGLPGSIGGLKDLVDLSLESNNLEGAIPSSFGDLVSLESVDLSKNNLSGVIPKSLEVLSHLKYLNLSFNRLEGEIPNGGPFQNFSVLSYVSNGALCGEARLHVPRCKKSTLNRNSKKASTSNLKYIIPGIVSAMLLVASASMLIQRRKRKAEVVTETTLLPQLLWQRFSRAELVRATNGFNESNLLGTGCFGSIYKGTISDGRNVAVKVFNLQLEGAFRSFDSECEVLSQILHRNLIKIISCCSQVDFKALILQYMPNGSLENWLYSQSSPLSILHRLNIMTDAASALEYIHHGYSIPIVHCDVKPSNILLDDDMVAHVADFGIAKLIGEGDSMTQTMTLATVGYMAPELGMEGIVSTRGDVYSFGIVLMETFTKRKPTDEMFVGETSLKQWIASSLLSDDAFVEIVDAGLLGTEEDGGFGSRRDCVSSVMRLALACCAELPEERISMQDALVALKKNQDQVFEGLWRTRVLIFLLSNTIIFRRLRQANVAVQLNNSSHALMHSRKTSNPRLYSRLNSQGAVTPQIK
ncbi:probable LRR receptor-like serine/threonine-protein kinase At3g47570 [Malus domestica]|uniref:probable LRR receptor-like serine/threonine-protein kinase At3g47570 n=1 Tax=Malus domestica TaxID=3750 RepID=UPI0010A9B4DC|nr:LRR receptor-like serine/threonine-protein kinase EFR [Malus domestica]